MTTKDFLHPVETVEEEVFRSNPRPRATPLLILALLVALLAALI